MLVSELKVYRDTYRLVLLIHLLIPSFPNIYKHSLGNTLCKESGELFVPILMANRAEDKKDRVKYLERFLIYFETVKIRLRLAYDLHCINLTQYSQLVELMVNIGKQINGWKKSSLK